MYICPQYRALIIIFYLICFFADSGIANSEKTIPNLKISAAVGNADMKEMTWPFKLQPLWKKNLEGGMEFFWALQLQLPGKSGISNIQAQFSEVGVKTKTKEVVVNNQTLFLGLRSLSDQILVTLKDNTHIEIKIDLSFKTHEIIQEGCEENNIKLEPPLIDDKTKGTKSQSKVNLPLPHFYMAVRCEPIVNGINLFVTFPKEVHWQTSTLFESKGKGKNWKNFEISPQTIASGLTELGNFVVEYKQANYPYHVTIEKTEIVRPITLFRLSLGMIRLGLKNGDVQDSVSKMSSYVMFETRPWNPRFSFGGAGMTSLPTLSKTGLYSHTEAMGYIGYTLVQTGSLLLEPRLYLYLAEGVSQLIQFYYVLSTFAVGGVLHYDINSRNRISLEGFYMKTSQQSILSSRLFYLHTNLNKNKVGGWGVALVSQTSGMNLQSVNFGKGSQFFLGPFIDF